MASDSKRGWHVVGSSFERSAAKVSQSPDPDLPEIAIAGRSNVGKSSLLNALCGRRGLARVSRTPGRTQLLNFFSLTLRGPGHPSVPLRFCDLPGYGFAAAHKSIRQGFAPMIEGYLSTRENLRALVLLVDVRRGVGDQDLEMMQFLATRQLPTLLVATKADKIGASARGLARRKLAASLGIDARDVLLTSASAGMGIEGRDGLAADLGHLVLESLGDPDDSAHESAAEVDAPDVVTDGAAGDSPVNPSQDP